MTEERGSRPKRSDATPSLELVPSRWTDRRSLLTNRSSLVVVMGGREIAVELLEGEVFLLEVGPVVILRFEESDDDRVWDRREGRGDGAVDTGENLAC